MAEHEQKYILLYGLVGERVLGPGKKKAVRTEVLKGEILIALPEEQQPNDTTKVLLTGVELKNLQVECPTSGLARVTDEEADLLLGIPSPLERHLIFHQRSKLEAGKKIEATTKVFVKLKEYAKEAPGIVRYKGPLPTVNGTMFGVELTERKGQGTSNGKFRNIQYFICPNDCAVFVSLDKLTLQNDSLEHEKSSSSVGSKGNENGIQMNQEELLSIMTGYVDKRVVVYLDEMPVRGVLRAVLGTHSRSHGTAMAGIELDERYGAGNGMYRGRQLFCCKNDHALFVPLASVIPEKTFDSVSNGEQNEQEKRFAEAEGQKGQTWQDGASASSLPLLWDHFSNHDSSEGSDESSVGNPVSVMSHSSQEWLIEESDADGQVDGGDDGCGCDSSGGPSDREQISTIKEGTEERNSRAMEQDINTLEIRNGEKQVTIKALPEEISALSEEATEEGNSSQNRRQEVAEERDLIQNLRQELAEERGLNQHLRQELTEEQNMRQILQQELAERDLNQNLRLELAEERYLNQNLRQELAEEQNMRQILQQELAERDMNQNLLQELAAERDLNQNLRQELAEERDLNQNLRQELAEERDLNQNIRQELAEERDLNQNLRQELAEERDLNQNIRQELAEERDLNQNLRQELAEEQNMRQILQQEREQNGRLEDQLELAESENRQLQQALQEVRSRDTTPDWAIESNEIHLFERELGWGAYGVVQEGGFRGSRVAVKKLHSLILSDHNRRLFEREITVASRCRHPNLLQFIGATVDVGNPLIVMELMERSLRDLLEEIAYRETTLSKDGYLIIASDTAKALNYLHLFKPSGIIHRDISSGNVLLWKGNTYWRAKVSDYGTANIMRQSMTVNPGAAIYSAPEAGTSTQTPKMDVYSFGVLLCEICVGEQPDPRTRRFQIASVTDNDTRNLIRNCTKENPEERPSMQDVLVELTATDL